jgi:hypothetical protein
MNPRLQYIFNSEIEELKKSFLDLKKIVDERTYKYEVMLAFWLSIELEKVEEARVLVEIDPIIEQIVINLRDNGAIWLKSQTRLNEKRKLKGLSFL